MVDLFVTSNHNENFSMCKQNEIFNSMFFIRNFLFENFYSFLSIFYIRDFNYFIKNPHKDNGELTE